MKNDQRELQPFMRLGRQVDKRYLPPVSLIPAAIFPLVSLTQVANLPPVSLIPVVHLDLRISPRIFKKMSYDPIVFFSGAGGKMVHEKNLKQKIS
jgi:hypothetical protein